MFPARRGPQIQNKGTFKLKNRQGGGRFFSPLRKKKNRHAVVLVKNP